MAVDPKAPTSHTVEVTHNGAPVPNNLAKEVLQAVGDLARHPAFHQLLAHAPGMNGAKADDAIALVTGAISEADLRLSTPTMSGRHNNDRRSLRMVGMGTDAPTPAAGTLRNEHIALETKSPGRSTLPAARV